MVEWAHLMDAYGSASNVPDLIEAGRGSFR